VKTSAGKRKAEDVEDRYYTKAEYDALSPEAKKALAAKRSKRGHVPGSKSSKVQGKGKGKTAMKTNADVIKKLKAVERSVSQLTKKAEADDDSVASTTSNSSEGNSPTKVKKYGHPTKEQTTNRTHKALIRLKKASAGK
jgi:hypothetical protein